MSGSSSLAFPSIFGEFGSQASKDETLGQTKFLLDLSDQLSSRELSNLIFLCKGVVLPQSVTDEIRSFPDLVRSLENKDKTNIWKITKDMKDYLVLFDILELIRRKDIIRKIKEYGRKYDHNNKKQNLDSGKGILLTKLVPIFVPEENAGEKNVDVTEKNLALKEILKKGEYSDFWKGQVEGKYDFIVEAYKVSRSSDLQQSFAAQGDIQCRLKHQHIVDVLRVFRNREPPWIVLEWMENGSLSNFLRSSDSKKLDNSRLISFSAQIADGMSFMEQQRFAHCNLRADNIFVTADLRIKIAGFCLARKLLRPENVCELEEDVRLPLRWSSLDVIRYRQVTDKSDVWSFGVVLLELFTKGEVPYQGMEIKEIISKLRQGYRHPQPENCPKGIYHLMRCCWNMPEDQRPSFKDLKPHLENYKDDNVYGGNSRLAIVEATTSGSIKNGYRKSSYWIKQNDGEQNSSAKRNKRESYARYIEQSSSCVVPSGSEEIFGSCNRKSRFPSESTDDLELPRNDVDLLEQIGSGEFGEVWKARLRAMKEVAVKMFIPTRMEPQSCLEEAKMMKKFNHPNIVSLIGVCSNGLPIFIITELMPLGNLLDYLRRDGGVSLGKHRLLEYAAQVVDAMSNVEALNCIHRDIAARNVLVANEKTVKLADFGLSRSLISTYYQVKQDALMPVRWAAPEVAASNKFSIKSDVWAFGILLVEIMTYGEVPYSDMNHREVLEQVKKGYKHPQPVDTCPDDIYEVMITCWRIKPDKRPSFQELLNTIKSLIKVYQRLSNC